MSPVLWNTSFYFLKPFLTSNQDLCKKKIDSPHYSHLHVTDLKRHFPYKKSYMYPKDLDISRQVRTLIKENDKTFKFIRHVSTETSIIFSWLMYKALEVEFLSRKKC